MIEFNTYNIKGKKIRVTAPNKWRELNIEQFIRVENCKSRDVLQLFCIVTGLDIEVPENSTDKNLEETIWAVVQFVGENVNWEEINAPPDFEIDGKVYKVPQKFGSMMTGQKILLAQTIVEVTDMIDKMHRILAIIFMPQYSGGKFDSNRIDELAGKIMGSNGVNGYGIVKGFFLRSKHLKRNGINGLKEYLDRPRLPVKVQRNWLKSTG